MPGEEKEKVLGSVGLAELIGRIKAAVAAAGSPPDEVTITENEDGKLEAVVDQSGGVTSYEKHLADIVVADEETLTKSGTEMSLKQGGIQTEFLADGAVTTAKIASSAVTSDKLADGSVETSRIVDHSVTPAKLSGVIPPELGGTGVTDFDISMIPQVKVYRKGDGTSSYVDGVYNTTDDYVIVLFVVSECFGAIIIGARSENIDFDFTVTIPRANLPDGFELGGFSSTYYPDGRTVDLYEPIGGSSSSGNMSYDHIGDMTVGTSGDLVIHVDTNYGQSMSGSKFVTSPFLFSLA